MNAVQAAAELRRPLRFGDPKQIAAVQLLDGIEELKAAAREDRARKCPACDGKSYINASDCGCGDDEDCNLCARGWAEACGLCDEIGILDDDAEPWRRAADFTPEALEEFRLWMRAYGTVAEVVGNAR